MCSPVHPIAAVQQGNARITINQVPSEPCQNYSWLLAGSMRIVCLCFPQVMMHPLLKAQGSQAGVWQCGCVAPVMHTGPFTEGLHKQEQINAAVLHQSCIDIQATSLKVPLIRIERYWDKIKGSPWSIVVGSSGLGWVRSLFLPAWNSRIMLNY